MYKREGEDLKTECHRADLVAKVKWYFSEQLFKSLLTDLGLDTKINKHDTNINLSLIFLLLICNCCKLPDYPHLTSNCLLDGGSLAIKWFWQTVTFKKIKGKGTY